MPAWRLAALPTNAKIAAFGTTQGTTQPLIAATNVAGTSLENAGHDQLSGTVIARSQTTLTVRDATWTDGNGDFDFEQHDAKVTVGDGTVVDEQGKTGAFTTADVSVGQHIEAFGAATRDGDHALTLDASSGQVRLDVTPVWGVVTSLQPGGERDIACRSTVCPRRPSTSPVPAAVLPIMPAPVPPVPWITNRHSP